jgi:hypothetical protein
MLENVTVQNFEFANLLLKHTYGTILANVQARGEGTASPQYDLRLEDGYNNATTILGGDFNSSTIAAVYIGSGTTGLHAQNPVIEANHRDGIVVRAPSYDLQLNNLYFEANGEGSSDGCDLSVPFSGGYDAPVVSLSVRSASFNSARCAARIESTVNLDFAFNVGYPPKPGIGTTTNTVLLGRGISRPHIEGNRGLDFLASSRFPLVEFPWSVVENLFTESDSLNHTSWVIEEGAISQNPVRFADGANTWRLDLMSSGPEHPSGIYQRIGVQAGHLVGVGAWMRTDNGSATVVSKVSGTSNYNGSILNQPNRVLIADEWKWVWDTITVPDTDGSPIIAGWAVYANTDSPSRAVYIYRPQAWRDIVNGPPQYIKTSGRAIARSSPNAATMKDTQ